AGSIETGGWGAFRGLPGTARVATATQGLGPVLARRYHANRKRGAGKQPASLRWLRYPVGSTHRGRTRDHRHRAEGIESPGMPGAFFVSLCIVGVFGWRLHFVGAVFRRGALPTIL